MHDGTLVAWPYDRQAAAATGVVADPLALPHVRDAVLELHEDVGAMVEAQAVTRAQILVDPHPHERRLSGGSDRGTGPASVERGVPAAQGDELFVRTELDQVVVVDDTDTIRALGCRQPVGDDDHRTTGK